jgi:transposase
MANTTISMSKLKQIIRLKTQGYSQRKIARMASIHRGTVSSYLKQVAACGMSEEKLLALEENELEKLFEKPPLAAAVDQKKLETLKNFFPYAGKEMGRIGVDRYNLWMEYKAANANGYAYSHFCRQYKRWAKQQDVVMHFEYKAGEKLFIDFTGKKLEITNRESGEIKKVEVLVAVLGYSQYTYVEATENQRKEYFIAALENALHYFGGVPKAIVVDNLKSAVLKASKYEPTLNETLDDFSVHYGTAILPTRPYEPRDKALVEGAVNITYKRIFAALRDRVFFHVAELNTAIAELLQEKYNAIAFQGKEHSRSDLFIQIEKSQLSSLPLERYQIKYFKWITVLKTSHVYLLDDKHYYSVHYRYMGEKVKLIYTLSVVEVYCKGERIALHRRDCRPYGYTTVKDHMPSSHQFVSDWNPEKFLSWAQSIGEETKRVIEKILLLRIHPEQGYKSCVGILSFAKRVGKDRLNNACKRAVFYQSYSYNSIKSILDKGLDKEPIQEDPRQQSLPFHENIRGKEYYQ